MAKQRSGPASGNGIRRSWSRSDRPIPRLIIRPLQAFLDTESSSGLLLLGATALALVWANTAPGSYDAMWGTRFTIGLGRWGLSDDLRHWINDAAMAVFFYVVALEIKREFVVGELRSRRAAALPVVAALGGMIVPAAAYLAITAGTGLSRGWGIPMATDIAFALGILTLVGRGLPPSLRLFLLTLAIVDDVGAILVIAIFYAGSVSYVPLVIAAGLLGLIVVLRRVHVRAAITYLALSVAVWIALFESGVHATVAGVALGLATPAIAFQRPRAVSDEARRIADSTKDEPSDPDADTDQWQRLAALSRDVVSPLTRQERSLHPWTSFVIVPAFALANAGVRITRTAVTARTIRIILAVAVALAVGKLVGISLGVVAARRAGSELPAGAGVRHMAGVAALGGIGFTVSLFVATLAFSDQTMLNAAKLGVLCGSAVAGIAGATTLSRLRRGGVAHDRP